MYGLIIIHLFNKYLLIMPSIEVQPQEASNLVMMVVVCGVFVNRFRISIYNRECRRWIII